MDVLFGKVPRWIRLWLVVTPDQYIDVLLSHYTTDEYGHPIVLICDVPGEGQLVFPWHQVHRYARIGKEE